ncbi:hypothetical protein CgunFtcFv8_013553 [Champsocephalus gunnari]|uniref:Uncharacterized protein n=1 Tax=Champsocephalus gunnari TaxID=52237 RepID=A0AAN8DSG5_CHAGU|nr:hypothetical protein CgunFtcFv8_013553 [Champsocephalus gunnari]
MWIKDDVTLLRVLQPVSSHPSLSDHNVPPLFSVLGTVAATYLAIAIIVKYHTTPSVIVHIAPLYTGGISSWASMFSVIPTICFGFQVSATHMKCIHGGLLTLLTCVWNIMLW